MMNYYNAYIKSIACWDFKIPFNKREIREKIKKINTVFLETGRQFELFQLFDVKDNHVFECELANYTSKVEDTIDDEFCLLLLPLTLDNFASKSLRGNLFSKIHFFNSQDNNVYSENIYSFNDLPKSLGVVIKGTPVMKLEFEISNSKYFFNELLENETGHIIIWILLYTDIFMPRIINLTESIEGRYIENHLLCVENSSRLNGYLTHLGQRLKEFNPDIKKGEQEYGGYDNFITENGIII